ncbi:MAG: hypothetical protein AAF563_20265 [Pseudomonadota bacterium]
MTQAALSHAVSSFDLFQDRLKTELFSHPVITDNRYCAWFAGAALSQDDVVDFTRQFSVFSNQFLIAQTQRVINAANVEEMRAAKEILANELGVVFRARKNAKQDATGDDVDPDIVGIEGTVDGGTFRFRAAHYEWLLHFAAPLGLGFGDLGRRSLGTPATLAFCDELIRLYGSDDFSVSAGAGFAVENWAAAGFWKQLIDGLESFSASSGLDLNLGFFRWHDKIEDQHAAHTMAELKDLYFGPLDFDEESFIAAGRQMLDGVQVFWNGLDETRKQRRLS